MPAVPHRCSQRAKKSSHAYTNEFICKATRRTHFQKRALAPPIGGASVDRRRRFFRIPSQYGMPYRARGSCLCLKLRPSRQTSVPSLSSIESRTNRNAATAVNYLLDGGDHGRAAEDVGASIVGFGKYHYKYESGHEADTLLTGSRRPKTPCCMLVRVNLWRRFLLSATGRVAPVAVQAAQVEGAMTK
jgi:hypothetical protein